MLRACRITERWSLRMFKTHTSKISPQEAGIKGLRAQHQSVAEAVAKGAAVPELHRRDPAFKELVARKAEIRTPN